MTKTLVALVLIAGGILLVTRLVIPTSLCQPDCRRLRARIKSRKLGACRRLCRPATLAISSILGRSAR